MSQDSIVVHGKKLPLSPGMSVTVEVKTDRRKVIDYFLSSLQQYTDESLRERKIGLRQGFCFFTARKFGQ